MMAKTVVTLEISSVDSVDKKHKTNISYINPQATNEQIKEFARKLISLTNDMYLGVSKVTKEDVS